MPESAAVAQQIFESIDREVWIITAAAGEKRSGLLATWAMQASLDPDQPVLAVALATNHYTTELVQSSKAFAAHLFTADQIPMAARFALTSGRDRDKLAGLGWSPGPSGAPVIENCLAYLDCKVIGHYNAGDRQYFWGQVIAAARPREGRAVVQSQFMKALSADDRRILKEDMQRDIEIQKPLWNQWRLRGDQ